MCVCPGMRLRRQRQRSRGTTTTATSADACPINLYQRALRLKEDLDKLRENEKLLTEMIDQTGKCGTEADQARFLDKLQSLNIERRELEKGLRRIDRLRHLNRIRRMRR